MTFQADDIVIASFPKAGSTWVRFLVANLFSRLQPAVGTVDFHTVHEIVPEIGLADCPRRFDGLPQVWKTHDTWARASGRVVLVLRNPWDTLFSYFHYLTGERGKATSLGEVVTSSRFGARALVRHAASYLGSSAELLVVTYEELHARPEPAVRRLAEFLKLDATDEQIAATVSSSSFGSMQESEAVKGRKYGGSGFRFMRRGAIGEGYAAIVLEPRLDRHIRRELARCPSLQARFAAFEPSPSFFHTPPRRGAFDVDHVS